MVLVLLLVTFASMIMLDFLPGDPAVAVYGDAVTPEQSALVRDRLGLDDPIIRRYVAWLGDLGHGDLGESFRTREPVSEALLQRLPVTLEISVLAMVLSIVVSVPLASYSAYHQGSRIDGLIRGFSSLGVSSPPFLTGLLLSYLIAVRFELLPVSGWVALTDDPVENLRAALLPAFTLSLAEISIFTRVLRGDMAETLEQEYVVNARSRGLSSTRILFRHVLRPSSLSLLTLAGLAVGRTMGGSVLVEYIFALPGVGNLLLQSVEAKDFVIVQGIVVVSGVVFVVANVLVDWAYGVVDPRVNARRRAL